MGHSSQTPVFQVLQSAKSTGRQAPIDYGNIVAGSFARRNTCICLALSSSCIVTIRWSYRSTLNWDQGLSRSSMAMRDDVKRPEERDGFRFRGGHNALDLTSTLAARLKPAPRERLQTPSDLGRWFVAAGIVPNAPNVDAGDLDEARALREGIFSLAIARLNGEDAPSARNLLNHIAAKPSSVPQLDASGGLQLAGTASALLSSVAREAVLLFGGPQAGRVRQCESATCTIFFLDTSRAGDRRWCSMAGCGNQAKVREFRRRKAAG